MSDKPDPAACPATKTGRTATGPDEIRCERPAGHGGRHEGHTGAGRGMPVYWTDKTTTAH